MLFLLEMHSIAHPPTPHPHYVSSLSSTNRSPGDYYSRLQPLQDCSPGSRPLFSHPQTYNLNLNRSPLSASKPNKRRKRSTTQKRKHTFLKCFSNMWISTLKSSQEKKPLKICYISTWKKQCKKSPFEDFFLTTEIFQLEEAQRKTHFIKCFSKNWNMSNWRGIEKIPF